eukprot:scaffold16189_cov125-Cylindrotheca_fusiformis.AAC.8
MLRSTEAVLASLYPSMEKNCIVNEVGHMGNREPLLGVIEKPDPESSVDEHADADQPGTNRERGCSEDILPEYEPYQLLVRNDKLTCQIHLAVEDMQLCRHRLRQKQSARKETNQKEPSLVLLIRVLNSVRALCPHLLPVLNHPRRNDKSLRIKSTEWKKKKTAMCWILGREAYDIASVKHCKTIHNRISLILKGYIDVALAEEISNHILGDPDFWENRWIEELKKRATPRILNPLAILSEKCDANTIVSMGKQCDQDLLLDSKQSSSSIDQSYHQVINKLRVRILALLKKRFPKARCESSRYITQTICCCLLDSFLVLSTYGSCLSNLSLGVGADVDLSLWIPEAEEAKKKFQNGHINEETYRRSLKNYVYQVFRILRIRENEFRNMIAITRARVPVVKGTKLNARNPHSPDGSLNVWDSFRISKAVS